MISKIISFTLATAGCLIAARLFYMLSNHTLFLWTPATIISLIVLPAAYIALILTAFYKGHAARVNLVLASFSMLTALYVGELALILAGPYITLPSEFDRRNKLEVVLDLRKNGRAAVPSVHPKSIIPASLKVPSGEIIPLAGVPRSTTVFCNETGQYYIYDSDEYGFTNPLGSHSEHPEVVLIGDSFTQGFCAGQGTSYAELLRSAVPSLLNLGNNGNGPLVELASLREFGSLHKSPYVFWFYFEGNDIDDLSREMGHPILKKYLEDEEFSQNLIGRVPEYTNALIEYVETGIARETSRGAFQQLLKEAPHKLILWAKLWHVRALLGLTDIRRDWKQHQWNVNMSKVEVDQALAHILREAKETVEGWGGKFTVVYLPSYRNFGYDIRHPWRDRILELVKEIDIELIDLLPEFAAVQDPLTLYNYRKEGHYTAAGNELVARAVLKAMTSQSLPNNNINIRMASGSLASDVSSLRN